MASGFLQRRQRPCTAGAEKKKNRARQRGETEQDRGKKPTKQRQTVVHTAKTEINTSRKPRNPTLISSSLSPAKQKKEEKAMHGRERD